MNINTSALAGFKFAAAATCLALNLYRLYMLYPFNSITLVDVLGIATTAIAGHYLGSSALNSLKK